MNAFQRARNLSRARLKDFILRKTSHKPEQTLVIIDMQSGFMNDGEQDIVPAICDLIRHAKQNEWAIIVVEFHGYGETDEEISNMLVDYPHCTTVQKGSCNGGKEIIDCINEHPSWSLNLLVCGVYGPDCVAATVSGIFDTSDLAEVDVVTDATCPKYESYQDDEEREREVTVNEVVSCNTSVLS